jgi:hypothetical protein
MKELRWLGLALLLAGAPGLSAAPNIGYVYPAGGQQGATFQATISGQGLVGLTNVFISGEGVHATIVEHIGPISGKIRLLLGDRLKNMQRALKAAPKSDLTISFPHEYRTNEVVTLERAAMEREIEEIRKKLANPKNQRPPNPQLSDDVTLKVVIAPDARPGDRELRLQTISGLSNPMIFRVGTLPEFSAKPQICLIGPRNASQTKFGKLSKGGSPESEMRMAPPCVVNGQCMPGAEARWRFNATQGQRLVISVSARELIPYLADAVPGWFQATLALCDAKGKELAYDDDFRFNPDPVLYYEIPADGEYTIKIHDSIYRGREDFVYRVTIGELPFITGIFPLGGKVGEPTTIALTGWNLPAGTLTQDASGKEPGIYPLAVRKDDQLSNYVPFKLDTLPECQEKEPNPLPKTAQSVTLPIIINGRVAQPEDEDVFRFEGHAGDTIVAEVMARRLNSPLDSTLKLTDAQGKQVAFNDDFEDPAAGLTTHQADSFLMATLPADGPYYVHLTDGQNKGGPEYAYRLRISKPAPDFALRVVPASLYVRTGSSVPVTIHAIRTDGFTNDISLAIKDAPPGCKLKPNVLPAGTNQVKVTLTGPFEPQPAPISLSLEGRAQIAGREVMHQVVPATDMMQAFAYRHLVPAQSLEIAVTGRGRTPPVKVTAAKTKATKPTKTTTTKVTKSKQP